MKRNALVPVMSGRGRAPERLASAALLLLPLVLLSAALLYLRRAASVEGFEPVPGRAKVVYEEAPVIRHRGSDAASASAVAAQTLLRGAAEGAAPVVVTGDARLQDGPLVRVGAPGARPALVVDGGAGRIDVGGRLAVSGDLGVPGALRAREVHSLREQTPLRVTRGGADDASPETALEFGDDGLTAHVGTLALADASGAERVRLTASSASQHELAVPGARASVVLGREGAVVPSLRATSLSAASPSGSPLVADRLRVTRGAARVGALEASRATATDALRAGALAAGRLSPPTGASALTLGNSLEVDGRVRVRGDVRARAWCHGADCVDAAKWRDARRFVDAASLRGVARAAVGAELSARLEGLDARLEAWRLRRDPRLGPEGAQRLAALEGGAADSSVAGTPASRALGALTRDIDEMQRVWDTPTLLVGASTNANPETDPDHPAAANLDTTAADPGFRPGLVAADGGVVRFLGPTREGPHDDAGEDGPRGAEGAGALARDGDQLSVRLPPGPEGALTVGPGEGEPPFRLSPEGMTARNLHTNRVCFHGAGPPKCMGQEELRWRLLKHRYDHHVIFFTGEQFRGDYIVYDMREGSGSGARGVKEFNETVKSFIIANPRQTNIELNAVNAFDQKVLHGRVTLFSEKEFLGMQVTLCEDVTSLATIYFDSDTHCVGFGSMKFEMVTDYLCENPVGKPPPPPPPKMPQVKFKRWLVGKVKYGTRPGGACTKYDPADYNMHFTTGDTKAFEFGPNGCPVNATVFAEYDILSQDDSEVDPVNARYRYDLNERVVCGADRCDWPEKQVGQPPAFFEPPTRDVLPDAPDIGSVPAPTAVPTEAGAPAGAVFVPKPREKGRKRPNRRQRRRG